MNFYNKYIFNNNSYLKTYLVRETVKNNYNKKDLNKLIDKCLISNYNPFLNKNNIIECSEINLCKNTIKVDNSTNTEEILYKNNSCNTDFDKEFLRTIKKKVLKKIPKDEIVKDIDSKYHFNVNNTNASICQRIIINS